MRIAFVYDRVNKIGGAERVLVALHQIWPQAPLFTAVYQPAQARWAQVFRVQPSCLNRLPFIRSHHEWFANLMPLAFEAFDFSEFDVIISVTSAEAKGIITKPHQLHLCYLLTPTRYLWSHRKEYQGSGLIAAIRNPFLNHLADWDTIAATRPDVIATISEAVAARCQTYYQRTPDAVIYPPVDTNRYGRHPASCMSIKPGYFLIVSRLVPYKKVDLAIKACNTTGDRLVIVGTGSEYRRLKRMAGQTVTFLGAITDEQLACVYHHARGLLFPQEEEFGIVALEAQSAGLPVIAYAKGSGREIVKPGVTGFLIESQTEKDLVQALTALKNHTWYDKTIKAHADGFDQSRFKRRFKQFVEASWQQHNQT